MARDGLTDADARARLAAQWPIEEKVKRARLRDLDRPGLRGNRPAGQVDVYELRFEGTKAEVKTLSSRAFGLVPSSRPRLPRCPWPARSAPRRTYSTRGSAGTARAAPCCGSGSAGRRGDRGRRSRRASAPRSGRRARAAACSADSVCQIAWCSASACGMVHERFEQQLQRLGGRALRGEVPREREAGAPVLRVRGDQLAGTAPGSDPARRPARRRSRAARTPGRRARVTRRPAAPRPRSRPPDCPSWKRTSPRLRCAGAFRASSSIAASKRRAASAIVRRAQRRLAELVLEEREDLVVPRRLGLAVRAVGSAASFCRVA